MKVTACTYYYRYYNVISLIILYSVVNDVLLFCDALSSSTTPIRNPRQLFQTKTNNNNQYQSVPKWEIPTRKLEAPFPNGPCHGQVITIPPEDTFGIDVNLSKINLGGDLVLPPRSIQVWLPPNYNNDNNIRHPVLYVHDGQNAYNDTDSWTGCSWRLIGAIVRLADHGYFVKKPMPIVVMIPSAKGDFLPGIRRRHLEYGDINQPFAQAHADFVAQTVKPLIDSNFATSSKSQDTFVMGSSLGGQASLHLLLRYPYLFGGAACLSPAFGPAILEATSTIDKHDKNNILRKHGNKKIYLDIGGDLDNIKVPWFDVLDHVKSIHWWNPGYFWLDTQLQGQVLAMKSALQQANITHEYLEFPGGRHNERAWALRIHKPLLYLFGDTHKDL